MTSIKARSGVQTRPVAYEGFMGMDTSRDQRAMDTGREQHLVAANNVHCDWRGQIVRDPHATLRGGDLPVRHVRHVGIDFVAWAEITGSGLTLASDRSHTYVDAFPINAIPTSTVFNRKLFMAAKGLVPFTYNGAIWRPASASLANLGPAYLCSVQRRLCAAGVLGKETRVFLSRVDNEEVFPDDEPPDSESVLRAGYIDIANLLGTADVITGISPFEQDRLAIFTNDRTILYRIDADLELWAIDDRANIDVGCLSHNTICQTGGDVIFCSRSGVNTIRRSAENGILVNNITLSNKIEDMYRALVASTENPEEISAVYDRDMRQYHIFFPQPGGLLCKRLTATLNPDGQGEPRWTTGDFLQARCGSFLGGRLVLGTRGGVYDVLKTSASSGYAPVGTFKTPVLWHGSLTDDKETHSLIIQASGKGTIGLKVTDDIGRPLTSMVFEIEGTSDDSAFYDVPLSQQYERRFEHRYRGVQLEFTLQGESTLRIVGFAVVVRKG